MSKKEAMEPIDPKPPTGVKKGHSKKKILITAAVFVVLIIAVTLLYMFFFKKKEDNFNTVVTPENVDAVIAQLEESELTPIGSYEVVMSTTWTFPNDTSVSSDAYVENSVNNKNTVYFTISPNDDNKNILFTSPDLPVGSRLDNIKLENPLGAGEHEMVLTYHLIDDEHNEISSVSVSLTIIIEH